MKTSMYFILGIIFLITSYLIFNEIEIYDVMESDDSKGAKCLDGSNYQFYLQKGFGDGEKNFILFFDGGGWCSSKVYNSTLESCVKRTKTYLGSSVMTIGQK